MFKKRKQRRIQEVAKELKDLCMKLECKNCPYQNKIGNEKWECYLGATDKMDVEWKPRMWHP